MIKRKTVPLFWIIDDFNACTEVKNFDCFKNLIEEEDYEVERVDRIDDKTVMYILKKEVDGEEPEND